MIQIFFGCHLFAVDPALNDICRGRHLHRYHALNEIYTIPTLVLHAADPISHWIKQQVLNPIIIGPDKESEQWVADIVKKVHASFRMLSI